MELELFNVNDPNDKKKVFKVFKDTTKDVVKATFDWEASPKDRFVSYINIVSSTKPKKFIKAIYCKNLDAIEIYCRVGPNITTNDFGEKQMFELKDCKIDCLKITLIEHNEKETLIDECQIPPDLSPKHKNGNIIVGQP